MRRRFVLPIAVLIAIGAAFMAGSMVSASGAPSPVTYCACLTGGLLHNVGTTAPKCPARLSQVISWNQTGPQGLQGAPGAPGALGLKGDVGAKGDTGAKGDAGAPGSLTCDDEWRIDHAVPAFDVRPECAPIVAASSLGVGNGFETGGLRSIETAPYGNPPSDHDVAARFEVGGSVPVVLDAVELGLRRAVGNDAMDVWLVTEQPRNGSSSDFEPNMASPLEHWTTQAPATPGVVRLSSQTGALLQPGGHYWIVASLTAPSNQIAWYAGDQNVKTPGAAVEERYDIVVNGLPPGSWLGGSTRIGQALRVTGHPQ